MRFTALAISLPTWLLLTLPAPATQAPDPRWTSAFHVEASEWTSTGRNPYFVLEPGYTLELEHGADRLVIAVLDETKVIDGVTARVVEERETHQGQPVEVSRNYFAMSARTNAVFYFGEDVDEYTAGKISGHGGSWLAGVDGARFGLMMPGQPLVGAKYYQEIAPRLAMDRAEIVSVTDRLQTPAGTFSGVLKTVETSQLEPGSGEAKYYAAGVGLLRDGDLLLVRYGAKR